MPKTKARRRRRRARKGSSAAGKKTVRRRRRRSKASAPKRRRRSRRRKATAVASNPKRRRRRRRKARAVASNPKRRRRRRRKHAAVAMNPKRRRRRRRKSRGVAMNPKRRRRRRRSRRNPGLRYRRNSGGRRRRRRGGRRTRRNPGIARVAGGVTGSLRTRLKSLLQPQVWGPPALHGALGIGAATYGPMVLSGLAARVGLPIRNAGLGGVLLSGVSSAVAAALASGLAKFLPKSGIAGKVASGIGRNVMVGGMIWTVVRLIGELAPGIARTLYLPRVSGGMVTAGDGAAGLGVYGGYPGQYPSYVNLPGLGMVTSPEDLVAGESLARQQNAFAGGVGDFMELSGMQDAVPYGEIRGMNGGMGDWVELAPNSQLAMESFSPGGESF